jgi:hypothetical protein
MKKEARQRLVKVNRSLVKKYRVRMYDSVRIENESVEVNIIPLSGMKYLRL